MTGQMKNVNIAALLMAILGVTLPVWSASPLVNDPDINDDGVVNIVDLGLMRGCFFAQPVNRDADCGTSDLTGDGVVNATDLGRLRTSFFQTMPTPEEAQVQFGLLFPVTDVGDQVSALATGDLNGDGLLDLVSASSQLGEVSWAFGNGDGSYGPHNQRMIDGAGYVAIAQVDGDDNADLVVVERATGLIHALLGDGLGGFAAVSEPTTLMTDVTDVHVADFDLDGRDDLAASSGQLDQVAVVFGTEEGSFSSAVFLEQTDQVIELTVADVNGDELIDLVVLTRNTDAAHKAIVRVMLGSGTGSFAPPLDFASVTPGSIFDIPAYDIVAGDLNADGVTDLLLKSEYLDGTTLSPVREHGYVHAGIGGWHV